MVRADGLAVAARVGHRGLAVRSEREALAAAAQHAEVVVVGVVLHHQHDDVLDLRQQISADGQGRIRALARFRGFQPRRARYFISYRSSRSHTIPHLPTPTLRIVSPSARTTPTYA